MSVMLILKGMVTVGNERYGLYGVLAQEYESNKPEDFGKQEASDSGSVLIYETDDRDEAREIYQSGGFMRDGQWNVVTRVEDRQKQTTTRHKVPSKRDFDQQ